MRRAGHSLRSIGKAVGIGHQSARERFNRIVDDDCRHDPEAADYWRDHRKGDPR